MSQLPVPVTQVEIITLTDNYIDLVSMDNTEVVTRAMPLKGMEFSNSVLAEHGFSAVIRVTGAEGARSMIFDFGLSPDAAARNAEAIGLDLSAVEAAALSHGHLDHFGGIAAIAEKIGKKGIPLVLHPEAFKIARHIEPVPGVKIVMPVLKKEDAAAAGFEVVETDKPYSLLDGKILFLGEIPRVTDFEKGMPNAFYTDDSGEDKWDAITDDTALVMNLEGKGLVVLSGCAHSGIANTVAYAKKVTGVDKVHVVMGGFHLTGPAQAPVIAPTVDAVSAINPDWVVPTHCTGREAVKAFEAEFGDHFIQNMAGTTLRFA